ncbi:hypothetical protein [Roseicella aquatilis]|uniref:Uncharacterized protein n=1 Tax=Roseicella aquatilis TaxID=2527868 RepID=A0A4R4DEV2_9PROT|nr:hypothetical protein [Roseicella aquatilis]TCZ57944.1 hypothetical protein EXY23_17315 [Roseicella aquatilis]
MIRPPPQCQQSGFTPPGLPALRRSALALGLLLPGCASLEPVSGILAAVNIGSVTAIGRTVPDAAISAISGRDCSVVRLDRGQGYCRPKEPPPVPPPTCTRSLGSVDCWRQPPEASPPYRGLADGRAMLTAAQEADRTRRWPGLW